MTDGLSLYIHIPFCVKKCNYCDFLSFCPDEATMSSYFTALINEISSGRGLVESLRSYNKSPEKDNSIKSIFIGGGTPSYVDASYIRCILDKVREVFELRKDAEITIEVNPGSASLAKLQEYRNAGVNRISIGAQSMNDRELEVLGRVHNSADFHETFNNARAAGFDNINVDLMSALPGQSAASYNEGLMKVLALKPEHISAYSLIIEPGTPMYEHYMKVNDRDHADIEDELVREGLVAGENAPAAEDSIYPPLPSEDEERQMYEDTLLVLESAGYHRYEISNYSRNDGDYECRHNKVYWERGDYLAFGLGASGMYDNIRWANSSDIAVYNAFWDQHEKLSAKEVAAYLFMRNPIPTSPYAGIENVGIKAQIEETMFLGLREMKGISRDDFYNSFGKELDAFYCDILPELISQGFIEDLGHSIRLTPLGISLSNSVLARFLLEDYG
ncbi:radical SAM family heme chaperone HemW [Butyrivibrio sp. MC2013]|uniref:radical SAM family heme chaperone HemW n=1 Tax=Butyrivibrio sp. MC2013 TaxID=1280686 RepID=UPI000411B717|nr:radical SAM family heme chaperone HemW [Butyrivibrio sp. MC2013]